MKKLPIILLVTLALFSGCVQEKTQQGTIPTTSTTVTGGSTTTLSLDVDSNRYVNKEFGFSIVPPEGWTIDTAPQDQVVVSFVGPKETGFSYVEVRAMKLTDKMILEEFVEATKKDSEGQITFISERDRKINDINAHEFVSFSKQYSETIQFKQVAMIENNNLYVIIAGAPKDKYTTYDPVFEKSIQTFRIT
jgi:hypothetical protein